MLLILAGILTLQLLLNTIWHHTQVNHRKQYSTFSLSLIFGKIYTVCTLEYNEMNGSNYGISIDKAKSKELTKRDIMFHYMKFLT